MHQILMVISRCSFAYYIHLFTKEHSTLADNFLK